MKYLRLILFRLKFDKDGASVSVKTDKQPDVSTVEQIDVVQLMTKLDGQEARNVSSV